MSIKQIPNILFPNPLKNLHKYTFDHKTYYKNILITEKKLQFKTLQSAINNSQIPGDKTVALSSGIEKGKKKQKN